MGPGAFLRNHWPAVTITVTAVAIACAALVMLSSTPPNVIGMATGPGGGSYQDFGLRYRAALARENVEVRLVPSAGTMENLAMLHDRHSGVSVGLIQGGTVGADDKAGLESLGTVFYEPLWDFRRTGIEGVGFSGLRGRKISIGAEGSGTRVLSLQLLRAFGLEGQAELLALAPEAAAEQLLAGKIDAVFLSAPWNSPVVEKLLVDARVTLTGYEHVDALIVHYPFLTRLALPRGAADLARDIPPRDLVLIGTKASLVVRSDLHAAIQYLLLDAAAEIHSSASIFRRANEFPTSESVDIPLSGEARRFYRSGMPFLNEYFPFWLAELIRKLIILLIPALGLLYPMTQLLPRLYDRMMRSKISRAYGELWLLEEELVKADSEGRDTTEMIARLDRLDRYANRLRMPVAYVSMLYMLRDHIARAREGLKKHATTVSEAE